MKVVVDKMYKEFVIGKKKFEAGGNLVIATLIGSVFL